MCSGACVMARFSRVVYAVGDSKMGFLGGALKIHEVSTLNHRLAVTEGVLRDDCMLMLKTFFNLKREDGK